MKEIRYFCCACREFSIPIEKWWIEEAELYNLPWAYVYCRNPKCFALHHSDDVIANHETHLKQLAAENSATRAIH